MMLEFRATFDENITLKLLQCFMVFIKLQFTYYQRFLIETAALSSFQLHRQTHSIISKRTHSKHFLLYTAIPSLTIIRKKPQWMEKPTKELAFTYSLRY